MVKIMKARFCSLKQDSPTLGPQLTTGPCSFRTEPHEQLTSACVHTQLKLHKQRVSTNAWAQIVQMVGWHMHMQAGSPLPCPSPTGIPRLGITAFKKWEAFNRFKIILLGDMNGWVKMRQENTEKVIGPFRKPGMKANDGCWVSA